MMIQCAKLLVVNNINNNNNNNIYFILHFFCARKEQILNKQTKQQTWSWSRSWNRSCVWSTGSNKQTLMEQWIKRVRQSAVQMAHQEQTAQDLKRWRPQGKNTGHFHFSLSKARIGRRLDESASQPNMQIKGNSHAVCFWIWAALISKGEKLEKILAQATTTLKPNKQTKKSAKFVFCFLHWHLFCFCSA